MVDLKGGDEEEEEEGGGEEAFIHVEGWVWFR